jgi:hypothetical protein
VSEVYPVEPPRGWRAGDRAYCVKGTRRTVPTLEVGKVYTVAQVIPLEGMTGDGLAIAGIAMPDDVRGFYSNRFVRLPIGPRSLTRLDASIRRTWYDAYIANSGGRP